MAHTPAGRTFTDLVLEVFRLNGRLLAAGDRLSKPVGLTSARWQVLGAIEDQGRPVAQIARKMGLARQNVQRLADALEKEGMVVYAPNPDHRRAKLVCLTERGKKAFEELGRHQAAWANQMASCVRHSEMKLALEILRKLRSAVESRRVD
jgi:DNA-binding MarR family transcriptional regulator